MKKAYIFYGGWGGPEAQKNNAPFLKKLGEKKI